MIKISKVMNMEEFIMITAAFCIYSGCYDKSKDNNMTVGISERRM